MRLNSPLISDAGVTDIEPCSDAESSSAGSLNDYIPCSNKEGSLLADIRHTQWRKQKFSVSTLSKMHNCDIFPESVQIMDCHEKNHVALHALRFGNEYSTYWGRSVICVNVVCKNMQ